MQIKGEFYQKQKGLTLISLVVTIIILLILARDLNLNTIRRKWNLKTSNHSQTKNRRSKHKRNHQISIHHSQNDRRKYAKKHKRRTRRNIRNRKSKCCNT